MCPQPSVEVEAPPVIVVGLPMPQFRRIRLTPITGACGAEVAGVDLTRPLDEETLAEVMLAFEHFLVLVFRRQALTPDQHKAFSRYFGDLMELRATPLYPGHTDMQEVRREAHEPSGTTPNGTFHTDSPFRSRPPLCIVMRALEIPAFGGDTAFSNMYLACEGLSDGLKKVLDELKVKYSWHAFNPKQMPALRLRDSQSLAEPSDSEMENTWNAVRRHPRTGRKALFVTRAFFQGFEGWNPAESRALADYLDSQCSQLRYQCRVKWEKDTVVVWDNRFTQHCAVSDFEHQRRHLVRTTVIGETPL